MPKGRATCQLGRVGDAEPFEQVRGAVLVWSWVAPRALRDAVLTPPAWRAAAGTGKRALARGRAKAIHGGKQNIRFFPMRLSRYFLPVLKETPAEAQIVSHRLCCGRA